MGYSEDADDHGDINSGLSINDVDPGHLIPLWVSTRYAGRDLFMDIKSCGLCSCRQCFYGEEILGFGSIPIGANIKKN